MQFKKIIRAAEPLQISAIPAFANTNPMLYVLIFVAIVPMTVPHKVIKSFCAVAAVCVYFVAAYWLRATYAPESKLRFWARRSG